MKGRSSWFYLLLLVFVLAFKIREKLGDNSSVCVWHVTLTLDFVNVKKGYAQVKKESGELNTLIYQSSTNSIKTPSVSLGSR